MGGHRDNPAGIRSRLDTAIGWSDAVAAIGMPWLHFHDLRYTGNTLAAQAGLSLADPKACMGHHSGQAAMIYQHAGGRGRSEDRQHARYWHTGS